MSDRSGTAPAPSGRPAAPLHVVISRWGSPGDVLPYIAVGWALAGRGHDVTFVGSPHYEARAREAGLAFEAVGTLQDHERLMADADVWFASPQRDWPTTARTIGFPFYPPPAQAGSGGASADGGPAPIVVTTGSVAGSQFRFYETAVEACRMLERPAILVSPHREHIPEALPPNVTYLAFAPFSDLLGRASLVIHHGGIGTASYALAAGVPQVALPMRGDQFDNGNRLQRLGVAKMLAAAHTGPADLARAIAGLSSSRRTAARCRHWQALTDTTGCLSRAAEAIEALG